VVDQVLSVSQLLTQVEQALKEWFGGRLLTVKGEVLEANLHEASGHLFLKLVDPDYDGTTQRALIEARIWRTSVQKVAADLGEVGQWPLQAGAVIVVKGRLGFWKGRSQVQLTIEEVDLSALMGELALARKRLVERLVKEGLYDRNRACREPRFPLRVAVVGSPESQGLADFLGVLREAGYAFWVRVYPAVVEGKEAPESVARALRAVDCEWADVVALVRGGGGREGLAVFDSEEIARAIASMPIQVWTGIGHTGDLSVADQVAAKSFRTPTACAQALASRLAEADSSLEKLRERLARACSRDVDVASRELAARTRVLVASARGYSMNVGARLEDRLRRLREASDLVLREQARGAGGLMASLSAQARSRSQLVEADLKRRFDLASRESSLLADRWADRLAAAKSLLSAYDPRRQLARGWTITLGPDGKAVRSVDGIRVGDHLRTLVADGEIDSAVERTEAAREPNGSGGQPEDATTASGVSEEVSGTRAKGGTNAA
jgi:exodeoxyribonuclease VII large subunit